MNDIDCEEFVLAGVVMKRLLSGERTGAVLPLREQKRRIHEDADPCPRQGRRDGLRHRRRADGGDRRPASMSEGRREHLPAARHSAPAHEHERRSWQIHLDRDPRSLRPVSRGRWPPTSTGRGRRTADTRGDRASPRGFPKGRHHFALGLAVGQVTRLSSRPNLSHLRVDMLARRARSGVGPGGLNTSLP